MDTNRLRLQDMPSPSGRPSADSLSRSYRGSVAAHNLPDKLNEDASSAPRKFNPGLQNARGEPSGDLVNQNTPHQSTRLKGQSGYQPPSTHEMTGPSRKKFWPLRDPRDLPKKGIPSPGKSSHHSILSRDPSVTSRHTASYLGQNPSILDVSGGGGEPSIMGSRYDMTVLQSVAVQPSEGDDLGQLAAEPSFSEQYSQVPRFNSHDILASRMSDMENRFTQDIRLQAALQTSAEALEARKRMMDDSALEADHRTDGPPPLKSPMKAVLADSSPQQLPNGSVRPHVVEKHSSRHLKSSIQHSKPALTKTQMEFLATQPSKSGQAKRTAGIFHRQLSQGAGHKHGSDFTALSKLDARNDKSMSSHDRILAWLEQGERYMRLESSHSVSHKNMLDTSPSLATVEAKANFKSPRPSSKKKKRSRWHCTLPCLAI